MKQEWKVCTFMTNQVSGFGRGNVSLTWFKQISSIVLYYWIKGLVNRGLNKSWHGLSKMSTYKA